ncbi:MAG: MFS transporter [Bacillota bacterium]|nr:MFS transporter [Bacillota bacterium]
MNISKSFPALTHKNFRYFFIGSCISLIGTWIQNTSQSWLVLTLTNSPLKLGIVTALQFTPLLLFSLFAGAAVDRVSKKKLLIITQSSMMLLALILAVLVFTGKIKYWHILILATLLGLANTVDMPTRQSFIIEMVGKDDLLNAIALNSSMFNGARLIGPGIAGLLIYYLGFPLCFFLNAASFIPLIFGITRMKISEARNLADKEMSFKSIIHDIKDGIIYISRKDEIYRTVILIAIVGTFAMNYSVLIPLLAKEVLRSGSKGYGYLMSSMGAGSLISALIIAAKSKKPERSVLYISTFVISLMLLLIGFTKIYILGIFLLFLMGIFNVKFSTTANTRIQLASSNEYRGRVMSVYSLVFAGVTPIGSLFSGGISDRFGVSNAFIISAIVTAFLAVILLLTKNRSRN